MTDEEMIKIMQICEDENIPCEVCPLVEYDNCGEIRKKYFFDRFKELKSENAELKSSLTYANEECLKWHERAQNLLKDSGGSISGYEKKISDLQSENAALRERFLPCKVGDYVYDIANGTAYKTRVLEWRIFDNGHIACRTISSFPSLEEFGTRIFLKKEAAEARLAEMKGGKE